MSDNKDKAKKDKTSQKKSRFKTQYNTSDDDSDREVSTKNGRVKEHTDVPEQFKQYIDEMHQYYQQQQAYLQEQNAKCFQQLFQIVCQGQQKQPVMPQLPGSYLHPYCVPQNLQPNGPNFPRYHSSTGYNNNNNSSPARQPPPQGFVPPPPPPPNNDVIYEDVVNGTRVIVSETPRTGHSQYVKLPSISHHSKHDRAKRPAFNENEERRDGSSLSLPRESVPQVNLFISVAPHAQPTTECPSLLQPPPPPPPPPPCPATKPPHVSAGQHKKESSKYGLEDLGHTYVMPRRRSVKDALRERMKDRERYSSRSWVDRERE